ncbi:unnamed protein product, partial [Timema podura]|nr:unnamed protein product [Timema podura]
SCYTTAVLPHSLEATASCCGVAGQPDSLNDTFIQVQVVTLCFCAGVDSSYQKLQIKTTWLEVGPVAPSILRGALPKKIGLCNLGVEKK